MDPKHLRYDCGKKKQKPKHHRQNRLHSTDGRVNPGVVLHTLDVSERKPFNGEVRPTRRHVAVFLYKVKRVNINSLCGNSIGRQQGNVGTGELRIKSNDTGESKNTCRQQQKRL